MVLIVSAVGTSAIVPSDAASGSLDRGGASGGGHAMGGASLSSPGIVLSDDQTAELREVLNASNSLGEVQLIPQSDGRVSIAHSLSQG